MTPEKVAVVAVIYEEPEWADTERCLDKLNCPKFFVDRKGVGSLAKALNSGFRQWIQGKNGELHFEYVWFVTNVLFNETCLDTLVRVMDSSLFAGITPAFMSDNYACRPGPGRTGLTKCPYIEFTAPIVRADVFEKFPLDEDMPYWGHDLDWGHRVRKEGHALGVFYGEELGHTYIRNTRLTHRVTRRRLMNRRATNGETRVALIKKYGHDWKQVLCYK